MANWPISFKRPWPAWWRRLVVASRRANVFRILEIVCAVALVAMVFTSWYAFSSAPAKGGLVPSGQVATLLIGTLLPGMGLLVLMGRRRAIRRAAGSTARLHVRLVAIFSLIAAIPTLLVAIFAAILFQSGIEFWFSDNSRGMLENANRLARGYYEQNLRDVGNETVTMAGDLRSYLAQTSILSPEFAEGYSYQVVGRKLNESAILQKGKDGKLTIAAIIDPDEENRSELVGKEALRRIDAGEPVVVEANADRVTAFTAIDRDAGIYLYAARSSDALALSQWKRAQSVRQSYDVLTSKARSLQWRFNLALFFVSLALVWLAIWFALRFADRQVQPLTELVGAARRVGAGNFSVRVEGRTGADEIGLLNRAFNRMTAQIEQQTQALVSANKQLEERRAFTEAVLESITAGIISVDHDRKVLLMNSSAQKILLDQSGSAPIGLKLTEIAPQLGAMLEANLSGGLVQYGKDGELLSLAAKIAPAPGGHVITFEDITRQLVDQRQAAWSDVARRIAHEIKNPLTPIQLATERLSRRYGRQIETDRELFDELTSTIIRQVGDLRKMVDEFSSFARLPKPVFRQEDGVDLVRQALFLQEVAHPEIDYAFEADEGLPATIACDRHQFGQAMTNVLKNALEAVEARRKEADADYRGKIAVSVSADSDNFSITIRDNGIGLPNDRDRIVEPYMTTREKGTGLGLAIVNKIVEEHGGEMNFCANPGGGACVTLRLARDSLAGREAAE
ncbi:PAS domain-containing sensor histidine kinase [Croceicoccus estronivorus]|uniref:sensor histidine kinase n=1 Tax=Croceicoccus estronivorus TaxID=1172626 RepID=UPI00082C650D|nr:ATP-binding protein [Croceicoccus estronivorus]OCC24519.1 PAS domain-containing sensor histidine kinase [Croceicoccus estronivorus]